MVALHYFDMPGGRASCLNTAMVITDMSPVKQVRHSFQEWPNQKNKYPMGQMPVLELDDGYLLCQTSAILEFIFDKAGKTPECPVAAAKARAMIGNLWDCLQPTIDYIRASDEKKKELEASTGPNTAAMFKKLENIIKLTEKEGYFLGNGKDSVADVIFFDIFYSIMARPIPYDKKALITENCPSMKKIAERFRKEHASKVESLKDYSF